MIRHNDEFYLNEAFQGLKELNEEAFDLENEEGEKDFLDFYADDIEADDDEEIDVIDPEANDENELQDNYVGKAILECNCCHTRIYKDLKEVFLDDESGFANADEECPVCGQADGYTVIGKIEEFDPEKDFAEKEDEEENPDDIDLDDEDEIEDEEESEFSDEEVEEAFDFVKNGEEAKDRLEHSNLDEGKKCGGYDCQRDKDYDDALDADEKEEKKDESCNECVSDVASVKDDKSLEDDQKDLVHAADENIPAINEELIEEEDEKFPNPDKHEKVGEHKGVAIYKCSDCGKFAAKINGKKVKKDSKEELEAAIDVKNESLQEGISIDMNTKQVNADTADDVAIDVNAGTVNIGGGMGGDEMIAPLDDADMGEIEANIDPEAEAELGAPEDLVGDEVVNDAELDAAKDDFTPPADIDADVEDDLGLDGTGEDAEVEADEEEPDEFDNESFDFLGESFMRRVYENVKSFKSTNVARTNEGLVVEGTITFESGKSKPTKFVFENAKTSKKGKTILEGINTTFATTNKTFTLRCNVVENKLVCERLVYNYKVNTLNESNENEVIRVYGVCKA